VDVIGVGDCICGEMKMSVHVNSNIRILTEEITRLSVNLQQDDKIYVNYS